MTRPRLAPRSTGLGGALVPISTCVTSASHWIHELGLNGDISFDMCHRWHNDVINGLKFGGMGNHLSLALLRINIPSSPWHQDERLAQARGAFDEMLKHEKPDTCVLFKSLVHDMLSEEAGSEFQAEEDPKVALWESFAISNPLARKDAVVVNSRWMKLLRKMRADTQNFHQRKFVYLYTCAEMDMLATGQMGNIVAHAVGIPTVTSARRLTQEEMAIRRGSCNQLVMGLMDMLNPDTLRKDLICVAAGEPWEQEFGRMNVALRSCDRSRDWTHEHIESRFYTTCMATFSTLDLKTDCEEVLVHDPDRSHDAQRGHGVREAS